MSSAAYKDRGSVLASHLSKHPFQWVQYYGCWHLPIRAKQCHIDWCELGARALRERKNLLIMAPRGWAKTATIAHGFAAWYLLEYSQCQGKLLVVGETDEAATRRTGALKAELETNERIRAQWPGLMGDPWTTGEFNLGRRLDKTHHSRSVRAVGTGGQTIGARADLILGDDILSVENQWTKQQREKIHDWFHSTLERCLEPSGSIILIGTRKDAMDLYSELMESERWWCPQDWLTADFIGEDGGMYSRWPEAWPDHILQELYRDNPRIYGLDQRNQPLSRGSKPFEWSDIQAAIQRGSSVCSGPAHSMGLKQITQAWDVAGETEKSDKNTDFFACATVGYDDEGRHVIAEVWRERHISPTRWCQEVRRQYDRHKPSRLYCEVNGQQQFHRALAMKETGLSILEHNMSPKDIHDLTGRTAPLCSALETGRLVIPSGDARSKELARLIQEEFHEFPASGHDDIVKSVYMADKHLSDRSPTQSSPRGTSSHVAGISRPSKGS